MNAQKKIILCSNAERDIGFAMTRRVIEMLDTHCRRSVFCPVFDNGYSTGESLSGLDVTTLEDELPFAEMIITFGGDGTILQAARAAADHGVPILGINLGGKGFIAELEPEEISQINAAATGEYKIENRMMMDAEVLRNGVPIYRDFALNDVVIRGSNKVVELMLLGDGQRIMSFSGDGAVIATPTGSTAYSMAAGGPIVEPAAQNILVTPICAHALEAKPFILVSDRRVTVELGGKKHNPTFMSVDGGEHIDIQIGDIVNVCKSEKITRLVRLSTRSFYKKVSEKLGERF